jgi:hypothetical protein
LDRRLGRPQSRSERFGEEKNPTLPGVVNKRDIEEHHPLRYNAV